MKKKKILTGVAIGAALTGVMFGGCGQVQDLYGPPSETDESVLQTETGTVLSMEAGSVFTADSTAESEEPQTTDVETEEAQTTEDVIASTALPVPESEPDTAMPLYGPPADVAE